MWMRGADMGCGYGVWMRGEGMKVWDEGMGCRYGVQSYMGSGVGCGVTGGMGGVWGAGCGVQSYRGSGEGFGVMGEQLWGADMG